MNLEEIYAPVKQDLQRVEERLENIVTSEIYPVFESYDHILSSGGKRLRPALVLLSAKCLNGSSPMILLPSGRATRGEAGDNGRWLGGSIFPSQGLYGFGWYPGNARHRFGAIVLGKLAIETKN